MFRTNLVMAAAGAALLLAPAVARPWGAAHFGYTHVGPNGVYHTGRTAAYGPNGSYYGGHTSAYGGYRGGYGNGYGDGAVYHPNGGYYTGGSYAAGGRYHYNGAYGYYR